MSSRTPVTTEDCSHGFDESTPAMTKDNFSFLDTGAANDSCDNQGKESEYAASLTDECDDENLEQTRSPVRARTNHVVRKRAVNNSNKRKPPRKRRVTANLAATKYDIGESKLYHFMSSEHWTQSYVIRSSRRLITLVSTQ